MARERQQQQSDRQSEPPERTQVLFFQFLKDNSSNERKILESVPGITCLPGRDQVKFVSRMNGDEKAELRHYNNKALDEIVKFCTNFDVLVLDESLVCDPSEMS